MHYLPFIIHDLKIKKTVITRITVFFMITSEHTLNKTILIYDFKTSL